MAANTVGISVTMWSCMMYAVKLYKHSIILVAGIWVNRRGTGGLTSHGHINNSL